MAHRKGKRTRRYIVLFVTLSLLVTGWIVVYQIYHRIYAPNLKVDSGEPQFLYIPTESDFEQVCILLTGNGLKDISSFRWVAVKMNYPKLVKAGRYRLLDNASNIDLVRMLRSGQQTPVKVIFNNIRLNTQLAGVVAPSIEADSASIIKLLTDSVYLQKYNLTPRTALTMFIPNTYELYWNTLAEGFMGRMQKENNRFWNDQRLQKARDMNMVPVQISILASIVEEETQKDSEKPTIAGVYINRLRIGMLLQADPTVKYAVGDFTIRRVLDKHKAVKSPYNTYTYAGLPPGPICIPSIASIDAVLNYEKHEYLYFCAKDDMSGYHNFARTLQQHNRNAQAYQNALSRMRIFQ